MKPRLSLLLLAVLLVGCGAPAAPASAPPTVADAGPTTAAALPTQEPIAPRPRPTTTTPAEVAAEQPRVAPDRTAAAGTKALVSGLNGSAFDLYDAAVAGEDGNAIFSPYSIATAFSMVYAGARSETETQMADVLGFLPQERQHPAANALDRRLAALGAGEPKARVGEGEPFRLRNANAVWGQQGFPFEQPYLRTLARHYGAGVQAADFEGDPDGGRRAVNDWVEDRTEGRIEDILPPGAVTQDTRLVLANAIYFKASWLHPFDEDGTDEQPFTLLDGSRVSVPMMHQRGEPVPYAKGDDYEAIVLPYHGDTVDMLVIQPKARRFERVEAGLDAAFLARVRAAAERGAATVSMPRYDFESELDLADLLPGMGMPDAFGGDADFGGIATGAAPSISAAIHRATIAVDEHGTEATAATALSVGLTRGSVGTPPHVTIDRPFIFAITERETGAILFLGRVTNPAG